MTTQNDYREALLQYREAKGLLCLDLVALLAPLESEADKEAHDRIARRLGIMIGDENWNAFVERIADVVIELSRSK